MKSSPTKRITESSCYGYYSRNSTWAGRWPLGLRPIIGCVAKRRVAREAVALTLPSRLDEKWRFMTLTVRTGTRHSTSPVTAFTWTDLVYPLRKAQCTRGSRRLSSGAANVQMRWVASQRWRCPWNRRSRARCRRANRRE